MFKILYAKICGISMCKLIIYYKKKIDLHEFILKRDYGM